MLRRPFGATAALLLVCTAPAGADEDVHATARPALYGTLGFSYSSPLFEDEVGFTSGAVDIDGALGFNGRLGYRMSPHLATEIELDVVDGFDGRVGNRNSSLDIVSFTANVKGYLPLDSFHPFLGVGAGYMSLDSGDTLFLDDGTSPVFKVTGGFDFYPFASWNNWAVSVGASYHRPIADNNELDWVSVNFGIQYMLRFED